MRGATSIDTRTFAYTRARTLRGVAEGSGLKHVGTYAMSVYSVPVATFIVVRSSCPNNCLPDAPRDCSPGLT